MLLERQFSLSHPRLPGAQYPNVINIGTNKPLTAFEISGTQCGVGDISGNEVGIILILISF
jgi:hypothetical protein